MKARPIIGISCMHAYDKREEVMLAARPSYLQAIEDAGGIPLLIHLTGDEAVLRTLYNACAGILLPGGADIDPQEYGEAPHPQLGEVDRLRDAVELRLARWARADRKPILGICRGIQVLNVALGGTLYQDIGSQFTTSIEHRESGLRRNWEHLAHAIQVSGDSWLAEHLGTTELDVNTLHHQAIKDLAPGLRATAHAPDGIIEAVEWTGDQYIVGIQCHPERLWQEVDLRWRRVFGGFVEVCR